MSFKQFMSLPFVVQTAQGPLNQDISQKKIPWTTLQEPVPNHGKGFRPQEEEDEEDIEWDIDEASQNFTFKKIDDKEKKEIMGSLISTKPKTKISGESIDVSKIVTLEELESGLACESEEKVVDTKYSDLDVEFEKKLKLAKDKQEEAKLIQVEEEDYFSITEIEENKKNLKDSKKQKETPIFKSQKK